MSAVRGSVASRDHPACSLGRLLVQAHSFIAQSIAHRLRRSPLCATALKLFPISGPITARLSNGESAASHVVTPTASMRIAIPSPRRGWIGTRRVGLAAPNSYLYRPSPGLVPYSAGRCVQARFSHHPGLIGGQKRRSFGSVQNRGRGLKHRALRKAFGHLNLVGRDAQRTYMGFSGLTCGENSAGLSEHRGAITRAGNTHIRASCAKRLVLAAPPGARSDRPAEPPRRRQPGHHRRAPGQPSSGTRSASPPCPPAKTPSPSWPPRWPQGWPSSSGPRRPPMTDL